ncbi:hypothetical protein FJT64_025898 [Amphibalanus amphitrite]|uniref:Uncharacterized protein n=1 Tax=Amphibalanus amphitrite TaxID=1232801 RepID=A0A6A4WGK1_AMPAM|nr:hypothetical protein FJT64_025898 [Amphibalanus amphitrite]
MSVLRQFGGAPSASARPEERPVLPPTPTMAPSPLLLPLLLLLLSSGCQGRSNGAPNDACEDMTPRHQGIRPKAPESFPYQLQVTPRTVQPGGRASVEADRVQPVMTRAASLIFLSNTSTWEGDAAGSHAAGSHAAAACSSAPLM